MMHLSPGKEWPRTLTKHRLSAAWSLTPCKIATVLLTQQQLTLKYMRLHSTACCTDGSKDDH